MSFKIHRPKNMYYYILYCCAHCFKNKCTMHEVGIYTKYFRAFKKFIIFGFLKKNSCKSCKNKCVKMTRKQLQTVYVFAKRIFPPLISFILRAWAKLNPNFNVLNYLVMYMRYLKPKVANLTILLNCLTLPQ